MPESDHPSPPHHSPHIRGGFLHLLSGSIIGRGFSFAANLLISRTLGPGNLGIVNLILSTAQTVEMAVRSGVDFGLSYALTGEGATLSDARQAHIAHAALRVVQGSTLLVGLAVWLWVMPFGGLLPRALPLPRPWLVTVLLVICGLESLGTVHWDLLLLRGRTAALALRQGLFAPLKLALAWLAALQGGLAGALTGYAIAVAAQTLWLWRIGRALLPWPSQRSFHAPTALGLMRDGLPQYLTNVLATLVFLPLLANVARTAGLADVGFLRVGQILVQLFTMLPGALVPVLFVRLRADRDFGSRIRGAERSLKALWWTGLACLVLFLLIDRWLLLVFFGRDFLPALQATRVLVLGAIGESVGQLLHQPLLASRRMGLFLLAQNGSTLVAALAGALLIPRLGSGGFLSAKLIYGMLPLLLYYLDARGQYENPAPLDRLLLLSFALVPICWLPVGGTAAGAWEIVPLVGAMAMLTLDSRSLTGDQVKG
jgi:O-antigen/teichoic acid export membrane protein